MEWLVSWSWPLSLQNWLKQLKCSLGGAGSCEPKELCIRWGLNPGRKEYLWGTCAHRKVQGVPCGLRTKLCPTAEEAFAAAMQSVATIAFSGTEMVYVISLWRTVASSVHSVCCSYCKLQPGADCQTWLVRCIVVSGIVEVVATSLLYCVVRLLVVWFRDVSHYSSTGACSYKCLFT